jgi:hypothetical protein
MKLHANARTCPKSRRLIVRRIEGEGWSRAAAAEGVGVERTAAKVKSAAVSADDYVAWSQPLPIASCRRSSGLSTAIH